jgi:hypothetical protein
MRVKKMLSLSALFVAYKNNSQRKKYFKGSQKAFKDDLQRFQAEITSDQKKMLVEVFSWLHSMGFIYNGAVGCGSAGFCHIDDVMDKTSPLGRLKFSIWFMRWPVKLEFGMYHGEEYGWNDPPGWDSTIRIDEMKVDVTKHLQHWAVTHDRTDLLAATLQSPIAAV